jgi:adenylate cyclase
VPTERTEQRKLAAIMFTDMVGYSALVQKNEALALKLLEEHRQLLRPLFHKHEGKEIKTIGDAFLVEFTSTLEAIRCAAEIQKILKEYNASPDQSFKIQIRVGLHMGDVVYRESDVFGDGVNIASRIEPLAKPGGICLSQQVYDQVHNKFAGKFIKLGAVDLKNIQAPLNIYRLVLPWEKGAWAFTNQLAFRVRQKKMRAAVAAALVLSFLLVAGWQIYRKSRPDARALFQEAKVLAQHSSGHLEGKENNPRIINLLEKAVKADPKFAEAYADLALAYVIRLFLYAPQDKTLQEKAYWAVDRALSLNPNLPAAYLARARLKWTPFHHFPHEDAINDFKHALALDPNLDEAHHYLGLVFVHVGLIEEARAEFKAAVALNPSNNGAQYRLGETLFFECKFREARNVIERIDVDFNPDLKESQLAWAMFASGQADKAITGIQNYLQQHPEDKGGLLASVQAMMFAATGKYDEAENKIATAQTRRGFGHFHHVEYDIACAYALMNKTDKSVEWFEKATGDGFNCYPMFEKDPSLDSVRNDPRFREIMDIEQKKWEYYRSKFGTSSAQTFSPSSVLPVYARAARLLLNRVMLDAEYVP